MDEVETYLLMRPLVAKVTIMVMQRKQMEGRLRWQILFRSRRLQLLSGHQFHSIASAEYPKRKGDESVKVNDKRTTTLPVLSPDTLQFTRNSNTPWAICLPLSVTIAVNACLIIHEYQLSFWWTAQASTTKSHVGMVIFTLLLHYNTYCNKGKMAMSQSTVCLPSIFLANTLHCTIKIFQI